MKDRTVYAVTAVPLRDDVASTFGAKERAYHFAKVESRTFAANTARQIAFGNGNGHNNPSLADSSYD